MPGGIPVSVNLEDPVGSGSYRFDPSAFKFRAGEAVDFILTSETAFHTFTVDELAIDVGVDPGQTIPFSFVFDKPGTYRLFCVPHESRGMAGTITVE